MISIAIGCVKDGKSEWLVNQHKKYFERSIYLKVDFQCTKKIECEIITHNKKTGIVGYIIPPDYKIEDESSVYCIDELQFLEDIEQLVLYEEVDGVDIYAAGLSLDYKRKYFESTMKLAAHADYIARPNEAKCEKCGKKARYSYKLFGENKRLENDEDAIYLPMCSRGYRRLVQKYGYIGNEEARNAITN